MQPEVEKTSRQALADATVFFNRAFSYSGLDNAVRGLLGLTRNLSHEHASLFDILRWSLWLNASTREALEEACSRIIFRQALTGSCNLAGPITIEGSGLQFIVDEVATDRFSLSIRETSNHEQNAVRDDVTGLPNQRILRERLAGLLEAPPGVALKQARYSALHIIKVRPVLGDSIEEQAREDPFFHAKLMQAVAQRIVQNKRLYDFLSYAGPSCFGVIQTEADNDLKSTAFKTRISRLLSEPFALDTAPPSLADIHFEWESFPLRGEAPVLEQALGDLLEHSSYSP